MNLEISENETRKDFSKAERIDYARRLERVESIKAKERQGTRSDLTSVEKKTEVQRTDEFVLHRRAYKKEGKFRNRGLILQLI